MVLPDKEGGLRSVDCSPILGLEEKELNLNRKNNETELQYVWRLGSAKDSGLINMTWDELAEVLNKNLREDESEYYGSSAYRKKYQQARAFRDEVFVKEESEDYQAELMVMKRELEKEKIKIQTEKLEYNRWLREEARDELITEKICTAIAALPRLSIPEKIVLSSTTKAYALIFGDEHYGAEFELKDLYGQILNAYSPEIFEQRMWLLLHKTVELIQKEGIEELNVFNMGDFSDGCLRVSQLMKLRYGVVDGTIQYANFITNWLNELTKYVRVKFQMTDGNHTELRQINQPKGTFTEDNMGKVVREFIKVRLGNNPNFVFIENPTGYIFAQLACSTFLGIHGEVKNMSNALREFSQIYGVTIDYLCAGHLHHSKTEEIGVRSEVINIPSIIGIDDYSLSLRKTSNAGAKLLVFDNVDGLVCDYRIKLN